MDAIAIFENFGNEPEDTHVSTLVDEIRAAHDLKRQLDARVAVYSGIRIMRLKELRWNGLDDLYLELGITRQTADNYIAIARTFRDNPNCLDGIGIRKALAMARYGNDEDIVRFKDEEIWVGPDGCIMTYAEIQAETTREFEEKLRKISTKIIEEQNMKNKYRRELEDFTYECDKMREEDIKRQREHEAMIRNKDEAFAEWREKQKARIQELLVEREAILMEKRQLEGQKFSVNELFEAIDAGKSAAFDAVIKFNNLVPPESPDEYNRICYRMKEFLDWCRELYAFLKKDDANIYQNSGM